MSRLPDECPGHGIVCPLGAPTGVTCPPNSCDLVDGVRTMPPEPPTLNALLERDRERVERGLATFAAWFRKNYPGPSTIITEPDWHAPKIFRAVASAILSTFPVRGIAPEALSPVPEGEKTGAAAPIVPERFTGDFQLATEGRVILVFSPPIREYLRTLAWTVAPLPSPDSVPFGMGTRFLLFLDPKGFHLAHGRRIFVHGGQSLFQATQEGTFEGVVTPTGDLFCWVTAVRGISHQKAASLAAAPTKQSPVDHDALTLFDELGPKRR